MNGAAEYVVVNEAIVHVVVFGAAMLIESYGHSNNREDRGQRCGSDCLGKRGTFPWSNILFFSPCNVSARGRISILF